MKPGRRGIAVSVRAKPGARADRISGVRGETLLVEVRAAPERGRANDAIARVLATALGVRASVVVLKLGAGSRSKVFLLPPEAEGQLERLRKELA